MAEGKRNIGKVFELEFKDSMPPDWFVYRLKDDMSGYYGISNPCDFILYRRPNLLLLELKSHKGKSLPLAKIRDNQIRGMEKATAYDGVYAGFLINFRDVEETYYLSVGYVKKVIQAGERKSISLAYCRENGTLISQEKKRTRYRYDLRSWLDLYGGGRRK